MAKTSKKKTLMIANIVIIVGLLGAVGYLFNQNSNLKDQASLTTEEANKRLVTEINKVYDLPDGEEPVVAIVTNPDEFKKQYAAFDNAQSGDYLLFYRKNRLNVLYRKSEKKVVKTASVVVPVTVEVVGSESAISETSKKLQEFGTQITVVKTVKDGITQSFVFDVDGDQKAETESLSKKVGYDVGSTLPESIKPGAQTEVVIVAASGESSAPTPTVAP